MADVDKLLQMLHALVDAGNSMVVIEHNLDVIKNADWILDMGPEGAPAAPSGGRRHAGAGGQKQQRAIRANTFQNVVAQPITSCMSANITTETLLQGGDRMGFIKNRLISVFIGFATIIFPWAVWMSSAGNTSDADDSARVAADIWMLIIYVPILSTT